ncbi:AIS_HP2_G0016340.mRNA.1.CDS.1 [Saccharomyces cerevisiae]|nr:AIS_HP2_G0016340.mRNA.1.CDS.1 [Saccharomyces cerevisiae]CAI6489633.1 AIS_HP2_G0016340.mRNA.1.CDS.1 [Saccharomyces cerevisiae]
MKYGSRLQIVCLACVAVLFGAHRALGWELSHEEYHAAHLNELINLEEGPKNLLLPFNRTRIPGSEGSRDVQRFIIEHFNTTLAGEWAVETQPFEENGYRFNNLVMTLQNNASEFLVLAAHYDTKIVPTGMVGAIDSAASCAALLYTAQFLTHIARHERANEYSKLDVDPVITGSTLGVKIVFFDGEEAIEEWGPEDSIYGARQLAAQWLADGTMARVRLLLLMDLLGSGEEEPMVPSYYANSHQDYQLLNRIEDDLLFARDDGSMAQSPLAAEVARQRKLLDPTDYRFVGLGYSVVGDDHTPFLAAGVPVLHAIPLPFPSTWHTVQDDFQHLDAAETRHWTLLVCEFVVQSLRFRAQ